jgi:hypothetical protein
MFRLVLIVKVLGCCAGFLKQPEIIRGSQKIHGAPHVLSIIATTQKSGMQEPRFDDQDTFFGVFRGDCPKGGHQ